MLNRVLTKAETVHQITRKNLDEEDDLIEKAEEYESRALDMHEKIEGLQETMKKIENGLEMHKLIGEIKEFLELHGTKRGNDLPKQDIIMDQLALYDQVKIFKEDLPTKKEIELINSVEKKAN